MKIAIGTLLFTVSCSLISCVNDQAATTSNSSRIDVHKAVPILHHTDTILREDSYKYGDLGGIAQEVSQRSTMEVSVLDIVNSVRVCRLISNKNYIAERVSTIIKNQYADGEYAWVSRNL